MERNRSRIIAAALTAASLQLGGRQLEIRKHNEPDFVDTLMAAVRRSTFARMLAGGSRSRDSGGYPYRNGGQRRKRAMRARRMNNAGHGNRWSAKHA